MKSDFERNLTSRASDSWKQCGPVAPQAGEQTELITHREKPELGMEHPVLETSRGIRSQPRLRVIPDPSQLEFGIESSLAQTLHVIFMQAAT